MVKQYLFTPGPTTVPPECLLEMARPIIHHRTAGYRKIFAEVLDGLKYVFKTTNEVLTFSASGTGAMEASVSNLLSAGDRAIVVKGGKFGTRFAEICDAFGIEVVPVEVEWGKAVQPELIEKTLKDNRDVKAVFTTLCETSTGVLNDIKSIAGIVSASNAILVVDAISALGSVELNTDEWDVDVVLAGSQKGLMIPPGLSFASVSDRAWEQVKKSALPKYYFDFLKARKSQEKSDSAFTPAITLVIGLRKALAMIKEEGIENVIKRHAALAKATRAAARSMNLEIFADRPSNSVTAVRVPGKIDGAELVKRLRSKGVSIAGGQAHLKGKILRMAHMGYMNKFDVLQMVAALELELAEMGCPVRPGQGVGAAEEVFSSVVD